ncbi:MAG: hypothetical protein SFU86_25470 [Pirellulaceae bacterium]|nr:hypothetical protein [Pirellulaceae bacterium]
MAAKLTQIKKSLYVDDGLKRGPLTLFRLRAFPSSPFMLGQCTDRQLALWNLEAEPRQVKKGEFVVGDLVCPHPAGWIRGFDVASSSDFIATGGSDRTLRLWKWEGTRPSDKPVAQVAAHDGWVEAVAFSPDGSRLATVGADRQLKLWEAGSLKLLQTAPAHTGYPRDLAWTPDGSKIVTGGEDGQLIVWNGADLQPVATIGFGEANDQQGQNPALTGVYRLAISRDGQWLAAGGAKLTAVFELATGRGVGMVKESGVDVAFHPRFDWLAMGENQLRVWSYEVAKFAPKALSGDKDKEGRLKPLSLPALPGQEVANIKRNDYGQGIAFLDGGRQMALGKADGVVDLWEATEG